MKLQQHEGGGGGAGTDTGADRQEGGGGDRKTVELWIMEARKLTMVSGLSSYY